MNMPGTSPSIGIIGAGRAGTSLGAALGAAGFTLRGITARSSASQARAARELPGVPLLTAADAARADLLILAVADRDIAATAAALAPSLRAQTLVVHLSGGLGPDLLAPAHAAGAHTATFHPAFPFSGSAADATKLAGVVFTITTDDAGDYRLLAEVAERLGGHALPLPAEARPLYHAGLAYGGNFLVTLTADASRLLAAAGIDEPSAVLRPLMTAALAAALERGFAALTGPIRRGDSAVIAAHERAVDAADPAIGQMYRALARRTEELLGLEQLTQRPDKDPS